MRRAQQGQILVAGVVFLGLMCLIFWRFYFVGKVNLEVVRQRHALDAATYSGAVVQAQALNYASYINRSYMAHQIALAHVVTMASWSVFAATEAQRASMANPPAALIGMMFGPHHASAYQAAIPASAGGAKTELLAALFKTHNAFSLGLHQPASTAIYQQLPQWREQVIWQVLQDNYPEITELKSSPQAQLLITEDNWAQSLSWQTSSAFKPWLLSLVQHYEFLNNRNYDAKNSWVVHPRCPHMRHELRRRGQTHLDASGRWQAQDTQSFHALRSNRWIGCYHREYPMGWALVQGVASSKTQLTDESLAPEDFSQQDFWRWVQEHTTWDIFSGSANSLAQAWAQQQAIRWPSTGWVPFLSPKPTQAIARFATEFLLKAPSGLLVQSKSGAETYFEQPQPRSDQRLEQPHLFHAYWLARLQHSHWRQRLAELLGERP